MKVGTAVRMLIMDAFVAVIGYRLFGARGLGVVGGAYLLGVLMNAATKGYHIGS